MCFYLGLDWARLTDLLKERMPKSEDIFLEKIVQVSFDLPGINEAGVIDYVASLVQGTALETVFRHDGAVPGGEGETDDIGAIAGALKSRHPRHVKRFLNDLSVGLSVLRNTEKTSGAEVPHVPERAVLTWHLLHEVLPREEWEEISALRTNLDRFLERWSALDAAKEDSEHPEGTSAELAKVHGTGVLARHIPVLAGLSTLQLDRLVNLGSPPRDQQAAGRRTTGTADLDDPGGGGWVEVKGGSFEMGAEDMDRANPVHTVQVASFKISKFPVTNLQYARFLEATPQARHPDHWTDGRIPEGKDRHPVVKVSWNDAVAFCRWVGEKLAGHAPAEVRLPTEAEWEFAARGPAGREYPWGDEEPSRELANYGTNVGDTTPVDSYPKGATPDRGIFDMAGNVWEWCQDWYGEYSDRTDPDPTGPADGSSRVLRGGAFYNSPHYLRAAYRVDYRPEFRGGSFGFRVVWSSSGELK